MKRFGFCLALVSLLFVTSCATNPVTGRKELNLVSSDQEMQLGLTSFEKLKQDTPINRDPAINAMVQRVGKRLAAVANKDMPNAQWEFVVFDSKEANAFCLPGGKVGVYTGLLPITRDDSGLATVLAHEIAHAISHHAAERMSQGQLLQVGGSVLGAATASAKPITQQAVATAFDIGGPLAIELPHDRKQESEADHIGLIYMARAGYNPRAALDFWQRFATYNQQQGGSSTPGFLRTHPLDSKRIQQIQAWLPEAQQQLRVAGAPVNEPSGATPSGSQIIGRPK